MPVKNKVVRYSILFAGALSLISLPAFAGEYGSKGEGMTGKDGRHHRWFQKMDKDGDGKISEDEFQEATEKKFEHLDENGDGYVTEEEWRVAAKEWRKKHMKGHYQHHRGGSEGDEGHHGMKGTNGM